MNKNRKMTLQGQEYKLPLTDDGSKRWIQILIPLSGHPLRRVTLLLGMRKQSEVVLCLEEPK